MVARTIICGDFEWDMDKSETNLQKHGVSFDEAVTVFSDDMAMAFEDLVYAERFYLIGMSISTRVLVVVYAEQDERIRIISA